MGACSRLFGFVRVGSGWFGGSEVRGVRGTMLPRTNIGTTCHTLDGEPCLLSTRTQRRLKAEVAREHDSPWAGRPRYGMRSFDRLRMTDARAPSKSEPSRTNPNQPELVCMR